MTRDTSKTFQDVVLGIASRKAEAAAYRTQGKPDGVEDAREVYLASCKAIAESFEGAGYRYAKSGPHFTRRDETFKYQVQFQSSHHNIPGQHVRLWVHAGVSSSRIKKLREAHCPGKMVTDYVAGGMAHRLLASKPSMVEWELADPNTREMTVQDVIAFIDENVLPYFAMFSNPGALVERLAQEDIPALDFPHSLEFALCFSGAAAARRVLERFLKGRSDLLPEIEKAQREGLRRPLVGPSGYAEQVVFFRQMYGL